jgi:hypothetical protein
MTDAEWLADKIGEIAQERHELHVDAHGEQRCFSDHYEQIGLAGEFEFGAHIGQMPDLAQRLIGDRGWDFPVLFRYTVDVKAAAKPWYLIKEQASTKWADIYVLAGYETERRLAKCIGWEWGRKLKAAPVDAERFGHGVANHYIAAAELRPMEELYARIWRLG